MPLLTAAAPDPHDPESADLGQPRRTFGIAAIGLAAALPQRTLRGAGVDAQGRQPFLGQPVRQPARQGTALQHRPHRPRGAPAQHRRDRFGLAARLARPNNRPAGVDHARLRLSPGPADLALSAGAGTLAGTAFLLLAAAFRTAPAATIAPFQYSQMVYALAVGWLLFATAPTPRTLIGAAVVIGSGLYVLHREARARRPA